MAPTFKANPFGDDIIDEDMETDEPTLEETNLLAKNVAASARAAKKSVKKAPASTASTVVSVAGAPLEDDEKEALSAIKVNASLETDSDQLTAVMKILRKEQRTSLARFKAYLISGKLCNALAAALKRSMKNVDAVIVQAMLNNRYTDRLLTRCLGQSMVKHMENVGDDDTTCGFHGEDHIKMAAKIIVNAIVQGHQQVSRTPVSKKNLKMRADVLAMAQELSRATV